MTISTPPDGLLIGRLPDDVGVRIVFKSIARLSSAAGAVNNGDDSLFSSFSIVINVISSIKSSIVSSPSSTILVNNVLDGHASLDILDGQLQVVALALRWGVSKDPWAVALARRPGFILGNVREGLLVASLSELPVSSWVKKAKGGESEVRGELDIALVVDGATLTYLTLVGEELPFFPHGRIIVIGGIVDGEHPVLALTSESSVCCAHGYVARGIGMEVGGVILMRLTSHPPNF